MTRKEEIKKASFKKSMEYIGQDPFQEEAFISGAEWADENPCLEDDLHHAMAEKLFLENQKLKDEIETLRAR